MSKSLAEQIEKRGISPAQWHTLKNNLYPGAATDSVLLVVDYCNARKLDPMKKPCHIVAMDVTDKETGLKGKRDVVLPGIYEYRTTAHRTGQYLGHSTPSYGPDIDFLGVMAPEWCDFTVSRWNDKAQRAGEYPVRVYFSEVVATRYWNGAQSVNARWTKAPRQMLTKCAEAAALREAFPEELGGEPTAEEMYGQEAFDAAPEKDAATIEYFPEDTFLAKLPGWTKNIEAGLMSPEDLIAMVESKQPLSDEQKAQISNISAIAEGETVENS